MALSIEHRRVLQKLALQSVHWVASNPREAAAVGIGALTAVAAGFMALGARISGR